MAGLGLDTSGLGLGLVTSDLGLGNTVLPLHIGYWYKVVAMLQRLKISSTQRRSGKTLAFNSNIFMMAASIDPRYAFHWFMDHPGSAEEKNSLRHQIIGKLRIDKVNRINYL